MTMSSMIGQLARDASSDGFDVGTLLLYVGGAVLLAFFCSIGLIARIRENRISERRRAEEQNPKAEGQA